MASRRNVRDAARRALPRWRAVDEHGIELDILLQKRRDKAAAKRFFKRVLAACPVAPKKIVTDQLGSYPGAKAEIPRLANVKHVFVKACTRVSNRAENSHQPTRERERRMRGFRLPERTQSSCHASVRSASTLRSSVICCAPRTIANSSPHDSKRGVSSLALPNVRPPCSETRLSLPISRHGVRNVTAPWQCIDELQGRS
ncbi:hypothetical protein LMG27174_06571 [Paraburkholderia rhynchosiae]|uniref:DDE domain-containing protein n=1 Tax=Paraburkholderia rhynchosiae TaxID=487049 RepID=A0A6J5CPN7_9BURK|nr:hypothetical protein LMG27174_06571 [Paraburkholderia rhynchosiae]